MSKVRLYGNTSGYVDLKAPDVANDVTITLPNESGPFATETYVDNAIDTDGGVIIAVKHALFTGTQTNSTATGANFAVTNLSITHTLADAANKLIISAYLGQAADSAGYGQVGIGIADDGTLVGIADADGSRQLASAGGYISPSAVNWVATMPSVTFVYLPGNTASHTYTVRAINIGGSTRTLYINRNQRDTNNGDNNRATSGFVIQEVKV
jgi:hypothetical protein